MLTRRLSLKKETLASLSTEEMAAVAGGADASGPTCYSCPIQCKPIIAIHYSVVSPTNCCEGIPTFHRDAC